MKGKARYSLETSFVVELNRDLLVVPRLLRLHLRHIRRTLDSTAILTVSTCDYYYYYYYYYFFFYYYYNLTVRLLNINVIAIVLLFYFIYNYYIYYYIYLVL